MVFFVSLSKSGVKDDAWWERDRLNVVVESAARFVKKECGAEKIWRENREINGLQNENRDCNGLGREKRR